MESMQSRLSSLPEALISIEDPQIDRSKLYPLIEILFLTTSAVLSGFEECFINWATMNIELPHSGHCD